MQAPSACQGDLYERFASGQEMPPRLPTDLGHALQALAEDVALRGALGDEFCQQFMEFKSGEWQDYRQSVSAWELQRYADLF